MAFNYISAAEAASLIKHGYNIDVYKRQAVRDAPARNKTPHRGPPR